MGFGIQNNKKTKNKIAVINTQKPVKDKTSPPPPPSDLDKNNWESPTAHSTVARKGTLSSYSAPSLAIHSKKKTGGRITVGTINSTTVRKNKTVIIKQEVSKIKEEIAIEKYIGGEAEEAITIVIPELQIIIDYS
jgi:hypothetical protein